MSTIIVAGFILTYVIYVIWKKRSDIKKGKYCSCSDCGGCCGCSVKEEAEKKTLRKIVAVNSDTFLKKK